MLLSPLRLLGCGAACGGAGTYNTPSLTFGSTNASMRTVPTASKKFGLSGLAMEPPRLPLLDEALGSGGRNDDPFVDPGCRAEEAEEVTALDEKLRRPLSGGGSLGLVLLRLRWCLVVVMYRRGTAGNAALSF